MPWIFFIKYVTIKILFLTKKIPFCNLSFRNVIFTKLRIIKPMNKDFYVLGTLQTQVTWRLERTCVCINPNIFVNRFQQYIEHQWLPLCSWPFWPCLWSLWPWEPLVLPVTFQPIFTPAPVQGSKAILHRQIRNPKRAPNRCLSSPKNIEKKESNEMGSPLVCVNVRARPSGWIHKWVGFFFFALSRIGILVATHVYSIHKQFIF